uniref:RAD50-interacting protein 1 n=1 Tax=Daphnia galeata TaxID=27404 RepID=A0A8J2RSF7_9CRUS|nr:unnamed protein product [Daphnia galeata]
MAPFRVPAQALETAQEKLKFFITRTSKQEWKAFEIIDADENTMTNLGTANQFQAKLLSVMETKTRLPCIVCQAQQGAIFCSITYTSALSTKERLAHSRFKPSFYFVVFPNEVVFYCLKKSIPQVISETLIQVYDATRLIQLPLEGKYFRSLRQLHLNKIHKGRLCRRPVDAKHPMDSDVEMSDSDLSDKKDDVIQDEDEPWKKRKNDYYCKHFYPEKDPIITKFTVSSSSKFSGSRSTSKLQCDLRVTFRSDNLIKFFNYSMDKGILSEMTEENPDLQRKIVKALNEEIGSDLKQLHKLKELYDETKAVQNDLKEKLSLVSTEAPSKVQNTLRDVEELSQKLVTLEKQYLDLKDEAQSHLKTVDTFLENFSSQLQEIERLELEYSYLKCIKTVEDLSEKMQQSLQSNQDLEAVELYNKLVQHNCMLETSQCENLRKFVNDTVIFWFELLKEKMKKEMQDTLKLVQWPLISTNQEVLKAIPPPDVMSKFQLHFQCLGNLKIPSKQSVLHWCKLEDPSNVSDHVILSRFTPSSLAIQELIHPLMKRFVYHFSGNRPTNRRDKPEWYLRQILQWIGDHTKFIETNVQPLYAPNDAFTDFSRGLVQLAVEKLVKDTPVVLEDDTILAHTIGEVLSFESELRTSYNYPSSQPSALLVLSQPQFFTRWIALERAFAVEKMDVLLISDKAWTCVSGDSSEAEDEVRLTECGEGFLQMLLAITDRYKILPQPGHKLQFLDLQLELLDEFRIRLLQLARQDKFHELFANRSSPNISPILNTLTAVINVLEDWTDLPFFVQLYSYKIQTENIERLAAEAISNDEASLPWLRTQAQTNRDEEGSVFDSIIELLKRMQEDLLRRLVEAVMLEVKAKSQPYRLDKWASLPNPDEFIQPSLSPTGSAMLQAIAIGLLWLKDSLASTMFVEAWQKLASQFLLEELILQRQFNEGGVAQLCFDIQQNLIPLFGQYTTKPESYFKELKDACTLLRLPRPITLLLLDTLSVAVQDSESTSVKSNRATFSGKQALKDQGIKKLSVEDSLSVLRRRIL